MLLDRHLIHPRTFKISVPLVLSRLQEPSGDERCYNTQQLYRRMSSAEAQRWDGAAMAQDTTAMMQRYRSG
jgi:hypothetical protein